MRLACCVVLLLVVVKPAAAQGPSLAAVPNLHPSDVDVLLAAQAVLHTADMITTSYRPDVRLQRARSQPGSCPVFGKAGIARRIERRGQYPAGLHDRKVAAPSSEGGVVVGARFGGSGSLGDDRRHQRRQRTAASPRHWRSMTPNEQSGRPCRRGACDGASAQCAGDDADVRARSFRTAPVQRLRCHPPATIW